MKKITLNIPMEKELYDQLKERAVSLGFDSPQAYIRFWATAETTGSLNRGGLSIYHDLTQAKTQAMRYVELLFALKREDFPSVDLALRYLGAQLRYRSFKKSFKELANLDNKGIL